MYTMLGEAAAIDYHLREEALFPGKAAVRLRVSGVKERKWRWT